MFLLFLAFLCLKDRESNPEDLEFPTLEANNNTNEVDEATENTGEINNNFIVKGFMYQRLGVGGEMGEEGVIFGDDIGPHSFRLIRAVGLVPEERGKKKSLRVS